MIELDKIRSEPVTHEPFSFFMVENVLAAADLDAVRRDFPVVGSTGVYPLQELTYAGAFARLIEAINTRDLEAIMEEKFQVALADKPLMITVRGHCHRRDGRIHTDSKDKIVTCLLYLNEPDWEQAEGRLRLLRNGHDLNDMITEIPPNGGTLVAFKRSDNSFHGHTSFEGPRRYVMFNWVTSGLTLAKNMQRHTLSACLKRLSPFR